ncbi:alpha/beta hydrolase [Pacificimonas sp. WHA3]|uniref:Alpha/beta hydrolase n=1 Tax=Pacificimonas pallii TaxID=2827236 RepID=A0ABS6SEC3_9SPHN|nr:alpha/beta hydrolase [Pacificimonas pallii]MBV7256739.1 alpha/beta hydrolase [Pacificimonas pallii]
MPTEMLRFPSAKGHELGGTLVQAEGEWVDAPRATALFAHCFTCTMKSHAAVRLSRALAQQGVQVLRFDFTGLGESEGAFARSGFAANVNDVVSASEALSAGGHAPALLIGHSLGGAAVLAAASRIPSARAVVTLGAPYEVDHVLDQLGDSLKRIEKDGSAQVEIGGRPFEVSREFLDGTRGQGQRSRIETLRRALLVMHSPTDQIVGIEHAAKIFTAAKHPKSYVSLDDADHLLTRAADTEYAAGVITAWLQRYVDLPRE